VNRDETDEACYFYSPTLALFHLPAISISVLSKNEYPAITRTQYHLTVEKIMRRHIRMVSSLKSSCSACPLIGLPVLESLNTPAWSTNGAGRSLAER
jgi:hypothetical protein